MGALGCMFDVSGSVSLIHERYVATNVEIQDHERYDEDYAEDEQDTF